MVVVAYHEHKKSEGVKEKQYKKIFSIGSLFSYSFTPDSVTDVIIEISKGELLRINTVSFDQVPPNNKNVSLYVSSSDNEDPCFLCSSLNETVSVGLEICGSRVLKMFGTRDGNGLIHLFGTISRDTNIISHRELTSTSMVHSDEGRPTESASAKKMDVEVVREEAGEKSNGAKDSEMEVDNTHNAESEQKNDEKKTSIMEEEETEMEESCKESVKVKEKKTKDTKDDTKEDDKNDDNKTENVATDDKNKNDAPDAKKATTDNNTPDDTKNDSTSTSDASSATPKSKAQLRLEKKARRKLAKQKAKELQDAINKEQGYDKKNKNDNDNNTKTKTPTTPPPPTKNIIGKQRRLPGNLLIKDILLGHGQEVKTGRRVSILYEGTLAKTNKVFDKNHDRSNPLRFRIGTSEVIRGLELGMQGMKVGGIRSVTIPPSLGYGKEGAGNGVIPGGATLVFEVELIGCGAGKR